MSEITVQPGCRGGKVIVPPSKSHLHRLLIADFLSKGNRFETERASSEDVSATKRCLNALRKADDTTTPICNCCESGSTLRFLIPVATALRTRVKFIAAGRLPNRPIEPFLNLLAEHGVKSETGTKFPLELSGRLNAGIYTVPGNISSQIISGLLFALPLLDGNSEIRISPPLQSAGYVNMTLQVVRAFGIEISETADGYGIRGNQVYEKHGDISAEGDWSGAAFWYAMNKLGSKIEISGLNNDSAQPDKAILSLLAQDGGTKDVSQCPDIFPVLTIAAAAFSGDTIFTGIQRLRMKESDRVAAMAEVLRCLGISTENSENEFIVHGKGVPFRPVQTEIPVFRDHRIAMSAAVAATVSTKPLTITDSECTAKSYPGFFDVLSQLTIL